MASVRIEGEAFQDRRYDRLAEYAGLVDADHARGKMASLWLQCTIEGRYILPECDVKRALGDRGVDALEFAGLGERTDDGVRIRGTRGRIEWLEQKRKEGRKHGQKGAKFGKLGGRPRKTGSKPGKGVSPEPPSPLNGNRVKNPPLTPALAPSPAPSEIPDLSQRAHEAVAATPTGVARRVYARYLGAFNAVRPPGVPEMGDRLGSKGERNIAESIPALLAEFDGDYAAVESLLDHVLEVAKAEAIRAQSVQWFDEDMWLPHRIAKTRVRRVEGEPGRGTSRSQGSTADLLDWQKQRIREAEERERNGE